MSHVKLVHFCGGFVGLGGVESVLKQHWEKDSGSDIHSQFIVFFESGPAKLERVHFLGLNSRSTIQHSRSQIARLVAEIQPDISVFHSMWGLPYLADLDRTKRRILMLHGDVPRLKELVQSRGQWVDGILCVSEPLQTAVRSYLPGMDPARIGFIPYPINPQGPAVSRTRWGKAPLILGFCGRLVKEQKRVDRLPQLFRQLDEAKVDYRVEFLGDGPERGWLEQQFHGDARFAFHGRQTGQEYWRIIGTWDVILFVSDYEGTPIALLEAMSQGVIPIYPRITSGGDAYTASISSDLLYEPGDIPRVSEILSRLRGRNEAEIDELRCRCRQRVAAHLGDNYHRVFSDIVRQTLALPRVGNNVFPRRPFPIDRCSFALLEKLGAIRRAVLKITRRS